MVERCHKEETGQNNHMVELCGLKLDSKGAPTPIEKAGKGRGDIDDMLDTTDAQTFRQAACTGLHMSIVHHSRLQCP